MTSRERLVAATRREPVDYVPLHGSFNPLSEVQRRGHQWQFPWPEDASADEQIAYQVEELGLDQIISTGLNVCAPVEADSRVWLDGDILHKAYITDAGELHAAVRYSDLWPHGMDLPFFSDFNVGHYVEPWLQTEADLQAFMSLRRTADDETIQQRAASAAGDALARAARYDLATMVHVGTGMTGAQHLFGVRELCMMTIEQPELVDAYVEFEHQQNLRALEALGNRGIDLVRRNGFYETADFYGPAMLERFLGERLRAERDAAHAGGMLMTYTIHTGVMPILDYLVSLGLDGLCGIDIAFPGVDFPRMVETLLPVSSLWTGPSSTQHIWKGPEPTRQAVREVFETVGKTGLVLTQCVSSHSIMPWESAGAMIDEWRHLR